MAHSKLLRLRQLLATLEDSASWRVSHRIVAKGTGSSEQQEDCCSTSYTADSVHTVLRGRHRLLQREVGSGLAHHQVASLLHFACCYHKSAVPDSRENAVSASFPEYTVLQRLLQHYHQNMGAVENAVTQLTQQLWQPQKRDAAVPLEQSAIAAAPELQDVVQEPDLSALEHANLQQLADTASLLIARDQPPERALLDMMLVRLEACLATGDFKPDLTSTVLSCLAHMGHRPPLKVIDAAADALGRDLEHCSPDTISNTMNSLAVFGRTHYPFLSKVAIAVRQRGSEFTNEALADLLYCFAILHYDAQHLVDSILQRILFELKHMSPAALSQLVSGLTLLNHRDAVTDVFLSELADAAVGQVEHFTARQLALLAHNYGELMQWGWSDQELLDAIIIRCLHEYKQLSAKELANLTWAIARANQSTSLSHALLGSIAIYAVEIMPQFEPHQLARLVHSYATLGYRSPELFDAANEQILDQLDCFATEDLSLIACANARLLHHAPKLIAPLMRRLESRFHELSAHGLCAAVWAAAVLNQLSFAAFERANALLDTKSLPEFTSRDFVRLFQAELLMEAQLAGGGPPPPRLVDWIRGHAERSLQDKLYLDRNVGSMQQEVCRCLMRLGINFDLENTIGGVLAVDIVLRMPDHPKLAVKVEQSSKYSTSRPNAPLADAMIARRLLKARGWQIICLAEHEWGRLRSFQDKLGHLEDKLRDELGQQALIKA